MCFILSGAVETCRMLAPTDRYDAALSTVQNGEVKLTRSVESSPPAAISTEAVGGGIKTRFRRFQHAFWTFRTSDNLFISLLAYDLENFVSGA